MELAEALHLVYIMASRQAMTPETADESTALKRVFDLEQQALETVNLYRLHLTQPVDQK